MTRFIRTIFPAVMAASLIITIGCSSTPASTSPAGAPATATVIRGDISVSVMVNGNLVMPQAFDLHFGAPGNVKDIFVEEGDIVKAGTVLATLDESSLELDIMAANTSMQQTIVRLYETIPDIQMTMGYPSFYPNASAALPARWAVDDVSAARDYLAQNRMPEAAARLRVATSDLDCCIRIFQDAMDNPESGLGSATLDEIKKYVTVEGGENGKYALVLQWHELIDRMRRAQQYIDNTAKNIAEGKYSGAGLVYLTLEINNIDIAVKDNVNRVQIRRINTQYPEEALCADLSRIAEDRLEKALELIQKGGLNSAEYDENLQIADHNMKVCNAILNSSIMVLENGLSLKNYQAANIDLSKAQISMANSRENLLKGVIIAPFDGMVVSVGIKKNDILSQVDYSSKGTVQLVDTKAIKFQGLVDEIDTLKIARDQKATISVDAVSGRTFAGRVSFISPYGTKVGNVIKFAITIELDPSDVELRGGLSASADIAVSTVKNVLKVPLTAITFIPQGASVSVITAPGAAPEKRQVKVGIQDNQFAEIISGLREGEKVLLGEKLTGKAPVVTTPGPPPPPR